jgi:hypothetical protein
MENHSIDAKTTIEGASIWLRWDVVRFGWGPNGALCDRGAAAILDGAGLCMNRSSWWAASR